MAGSLERREPTTLRASERLFRQPILTRLAKRAQSEFAIPPSREDVKIRAAEKIDVESFGPFLQVHGGEIPNSVYDSAARKQIGPGGVLITKKRLNLFLKALLKRRKSLLCAFRLDLDHHKRGVVTFDDFTRMWRILRFTGDPVSTWHSWLPSDDADILSVEHVCPDEIYNLQQFGEAIWCEVGLNLDTFWKSLDTDGNGYVSLQDFQSSARTISFSGDAELLFSGLDVGLFGKLTRKDLEYLEPYMRKSLQLHVDRLKAWFAEEFSEIDPADPVDFLVQLGLQRLGSFLHVDAFSSRLAILDYPYDALHASFVLARTRGSMDADDWFAGKLCCQSRVSRTTLCQFFGLIEPHQDVGVYIPQSDLFVPTSRIPGWIPSLGPQGFALKCP